MYFFPSQLQILDPFINSVNKTNFILFFLLFYSLLYYGGLYQNIHSIFIGKCFFAIIICIVFINHYFIKKKRNLLLFILISYFILALWTVLNSPFPIVDTFVVFYEAPLKFLNGQNPYTAQYTQIYAGKTYFHYLPNSFLMITPFMLLFHDPRFIIITANILSAIIISKLFRNKNNKTAVYLFIFAFLFLPRSFYILEHAYLDPLIFFFFVLSLYYEKKRNTFLSTLSLSFFFSIKQHLFILIPFILNSKSPQKYLKPKNVIALVVPFLSIAFFFFIDYKSFIERTITSMLGPVINPQLDSLRGSPIAISLSIQPLLQKTVLGQNSLLKYSFSFVLLIFSYLVLYFKKNEYRSNIILILFIFNYIMYVSFFNSYYFIGLFLMIEAAYKLFDLRS